jgi:hypothetical protein
MASNHALIPEKRRRHCNLGNFPAPRFIPSSAAAAPIRAFFVISDVTDAIEKGFLFPALRSCTEMRPG